MAAGLHLRIPQGRIGFLFIQRGNIMRKLVLFCTSLCAMVISFSASPALAQNVLWVSATGGGTACSTAAPCATFQVAINQGATEIHCLNSGNYGPVTISASIIIDCGTGNVGIISNGASNGVTINGGSLVVLRHLSVNGNGSAGGIGIFTGAGYSGTLVIEDCTIQGFANTAGIEFTPSAGRGLLKVSNSQILSNSFGIIITPSGGQIASATLSRVELSGNANSGLVLGPLMAGGNNGVVAGVIRDSIVEANGASGIVATANQVFFTVEASTVVANLQFGIVSNSAGTNVNVTASTISSNLMGVQPTAGSIVSFANNTLNGNTTDGNFTSTKPLR
jgi:hypothetical protein